MCGPLKGREWSLTPVLLAHPSSAKADERSEEVVEVGGEAGNGWMEQPSPTDGGGGNDRRDGAVLVRCGAWTLHYATAMLKCQRTSGRRSLWPSFKWGDDR